MENLIILISVLISVGSVVYVTEMNRRDMQTRYREFVKSVLSKDVEEYSNFTDEPGELPEEADELEDLSSVDEKILIKTLKSEDINN